MLSTTTLVQSVQDTEYLTSKSSPIYQFPQHSTSIASTYSSSDSHLTRVNTDSTDVLIPHPESIGSTSSHHLTSDDDGDDDHRQGTVNFTNTPKLTHQDHSPVLHQPPPSPRPFQKDQPPQQQRNNARKPAVLVSDLDVATLAQDFDSHRLDQTLPSPTTTLVPTSNTTPSPTKHSLFRLKRKDSKLSTPKKAKDTGKKTSHGIFHDLKRFLKTGGSSSSSTSTSSTSPRLNPTHAAHHGNTIETSLEKYGKMGKILGHGAGGTVRILTRESDNKSFAIKQFRKRRTAESDRIYTKKIMAEYTLGSTFHHPNIIETIDIIKEDDSFYEVMEYAKYELFSAVMEGDMGREEIACCFHGVVQGVAYLHEMGVAHRDLKLDNCVMNDDAHVKIIDFGCSMVCQLLFEKESALARGISGSDPYIAPEVFTSPEGYHARPADVWSLGIIFVCMTIGRFPWKIPKPDEDESFEAFAHPNGKGKQRVLKLLPRESRPIMSRILEVDPTKRATINDIVADPWFQSIDACTTEHKSCNHPHHLGDDNGVFLREPAPKATASPADV
ncbi:hypothetical protein BGZ94_000113 [Podila epigama]|nr:hypothetical protein BGZ94_000113 [Podila epigama]